MLLIHLICGDYDISIYISKDLKLKKQKQKPKKQNFQSYPLIIRSFTRTLRFKSCWGHFTNFLNKLYRQNLCPLKVYELRFQYIMVAEAEHQFIRKLASYVLQRFNHSYGDMSNLFSNKKCVLKECHQDIWHQRFILYLFLEMRSFILKIIIIMFCNSL